MTAPLRLRPAFKERLWGGRRLAERFGYDLPDGPIGECWGISALSSGPSTVVGGPHDGRTLAEVWDVDPAFFGHPAGPSLPLLVKLLDAHDWLSVQVHPDDAAAADLVGETRGKTECWYVVDAAPGAELVLGHHAADRAELGALVEAGDWEGLLRRRPVAGGDVIHVPAGTVHALGPGVLVYEVQQSSDVTYRLHDWDRTAADGAPRELHPHEAVQVTTVPFDPASTDTAADPDIVPGGRRRLLVRDPAFAVTLHQIRGEGYATSTPGYALWTIVAGSGSATVDHVPLPLSAGDHLVLPADAGEVHIAGELDLIEAIAG